MKKIILSICILFKVSAFGQGIKISALPNKSTWSQNDLMILVDSNLNSNATKKATVGAFALNYGFMTSGITSLNGNTAAAQTIAIGSNGTDFNLVNAGATHTFHLPTSDGTHTGKLSSSDWTLFNNKESALTFSNGLTRSTNTITSNLYTGVSGGQSVIGGTGVTENLTLTSTSNAAKGKIISGLLAYDEGNSYFSLLNTTPAYPFSIGFTRQFRINATGNIIRVNDIATSFPSVQGGAGTTIQNDGAGNWSWVSPSSGLIVGTTAISSGTGTRLLFESSGNILAETANMTYDATAGLSLTGTTANSTTYALKVFNSTPNLIFAARDDYRLYGGNAATGNLTIGQTVVVGTGTDNHVFGLDAFVANTTGSEMSAFGTQAGHSNTAGTENTWIGSGAGYNNAIGNYNVGVGRHVLFGALGDENTGLGDGAGQCISTSTANTAIGRLAMSGTATLTGTGQNTFIGNIAGKSMTGAINGNTGIGYAAGDASSLGTTVQGDYNTFLGGATKLALNLATTVTGSTAIGYLSLITASNQLMIGSVTAPIANAYIGQSVATPDANLFIGTIQTSDPGSGVGQWKMGAVQAAVVTLDTGHYIDVKINGVNYKILIAN